MGVVEKRASFGNLLEKTISGDELAREALAIEIRDAVRLKLKVLGLPQVDIDDLAQDCTIEIMRRIDVFDSNRGSLEAWMSGFAKNAFRMWARANAIRKTEYQAELSDEPGYEIFQSSEPRAALATALETIQIVDRELLYMRFTLGLSSDEIAKNTQMNSAQIRKRISRAVEKLRTHPSVAKLVV